MNILDEIIAHKRVEVVAKRSQLPLESVHAEALKAPVPPAFAQALRSVSMGLIAEVKHRSPSAGIIRTPFEPAQIAQCYERAGAQAVSVLMDEKFFGGGVDHFTAVRAAVNMPMLYKEFVVDEWQIWHARAIGASAVLLIAAVLSDQEILDLCACATNAGVEILLEVHDGEELSRALALGIDLIGINNRNLKTFETKLSHTLSLMSRVPESVTLISESGIRTHADIERLQAEGVSGVLVGEHLLRKPDLEIAVKDLMGR
ncbi:indole-3-glycerol phosphate synthase TrpC [Kiritimatiellota bacterium B12222]|nr:indole-3-glycerol phosphate synthase TrpC [Kiritimatiellota bacterium B12222]